MQLWVLMSHHSSTHIPLERDPKFDGRITRKARLRVRAYHGPVQGLGSTHSHAYKMLRAFTALEFLMAKQGRSLGTNCPVCIGIHMVVYYLTPMRSGSLGVETLTDLSD